MTAGQRRRARVLFWRGFNEGRIARQLGVTAQQVRRVLFVTVK